MQTTSLRGARLSSQQAHLWELQQNTQTYWVQCVVALKGEIQSEYLRLACEDVICRHEILRTIFHRLPGMDMPIQQVNAEVVLNFDEYNLQHLGALAQQRSIEEKLVALRTGEHDLSQDPAVHVSLFKCAEQQAFLLLSLPALCADIPTLERFLIEMTAFYAERTQQQSITFEDDVLQYADVSAWQNEVLEEEDARLHQTFWAQTDLSCLTSLPLPFKRLPLTTSEAFVPQRLAVQFPDTLSEEILRYAEQAGISPETFLLSCWSLLIWRLTKEDIFPTGVACNGRHYEDLEYALGLYTRVVPFSPDFEAECTFSQFLAQVQSRLEQAKDAQMYFHWDYLRRNQAKTQVGNFFPLSFEFALWPAERVVGELHCALIQCFSCTERFLLKLSAQQSERTLRWEWHYDATYMRAEQVQGVADSFLVLLQAAVSQPQTPIGHLPLLNREEQERLLQTFRGPERHYPAQTFQELFEEQSEKYAGSLAVVCGEKSLTYEQLNAQANRLAAWLKRRGVGPDVLVGLCLDRSVEMLVGLLAVLKAGGAYVPLDPELPTSRLAFLFEDTQALVLLTQEHLLERLPPFAGQIVCLDRDPNLWADEAATNPLPTSNANHLAYMIYTSGSTGVPKGVQICQRSIINYTCDMRERIAPVSGLHFATVSTLAADLGNTSIFCSLASGGCLHILPYETLASGEAFANYVENHPIDVLKIVPSHLQALLASSGERDIFPRRHLVLGGETLFVSFLQTLRQRGMQCAIVNHYGPTETTIGALVNELGVLSEELPVELDEASSVPVGYPISNVHICLVDQHQQIVPIGVVGELLIGGVGLAAGYLHQPELTHERFRTHPLFPELTVYKTGDLARYTADGKIEFVGRADRQVKLRGYRIELGEIEAALSRYPQIREAAVVLREEESAEKRLIAYVVSEQQEMLKDDEVRNFLQKNLPEYMLPTIIMQVTSLPLTANGKLNYRALPVPEQNMRRRQVSYVAPRNPIEEILVKIWQDVLQSSEKIGIYDSFFALGGHSLLVTQVISRLKTTLQITLPIISLFENATVAGLAERVEAEMHNDLRQHIPPLTPVGRDQDLPLSFSQQRLWFLSQLEPQNIAYNQAFALHIQGPLSVEALEYSLSEIVRRHEILRTTFIIKDDQPLQQINSWQEYHLRCQSLQNLALPQREQEIDRLMQEEARRPFDLSQGPLLRTLLLTLDENDYLLLLTMHHVVSDGWSNGILLSELRAFYTAYSTKKPAKVADLPIQYADYAVWQRQWFQGEVLEKQLDYWTQQLSDISPLPLPVDYPRPAVQSFNGAEFNFQIAGELVEQLKRVSQTEGTTLFMTLLTAFQVLLARYSGQEDIAVGTPVANRHYPGSENLIGPFINTLVLRTDLSGNPTLREALQRVRKVALDAYAHQDLPFERLVEVLHPQRDLSRSPLFQVMFVLQNMPMPEMSLEGVSLAPYQRENTTSKFDLTLTAIEREEGLQCVVEYNTDLFTSQSIAQLLGHWQRVLHMLAEQRDRPWRAFSLLSEQQRQHLLFDWNATELALPKLDLLPQQILTQAQQTPWRVAVRDTQETMTYGELARRSCQLAQVLYEAGVRTGDLVGVCLPRRVDLLAGLLAVWRVGAGYVPLDADYPQQRLQLMLQQSGARLVLTVPELSERLNWLPPERRLVLEREKLSEVDEADIYRVQEPVSAQDVAYVIYTSGSTGRPKGVAIGHGALRNSLGSLQEVLGLMAEERMLALTSLSFDIAGLELWQPLLGGGQVELLSGEHARDGEALLRVLEEREVTVMQGTPQTWRLLLQAGWQGRADVRLLCGGEALPQELAHQLVGKGKELWNLYGPTETTIWSVVERIEQGQPVRIGKPIGNTRVYVLDEQGEPVPVGVVGELWIAGASVGMGYWAAVGQTAERFVPEGFGREGGSRRYGTGDLVRWVRDEGGEAGRLEYVGRRDGQVKVRGYRIEVGEIEGELERQEEIAQAVVVVEGEGEEKHLVGYVVSQGGRELGEQEIKRRLRKRLPGYLVPERLVGVEQMPLTLNGKVDRRALSGLASSISPVIETDEQPQSQIEELLASLWATILQRDSIGREANFFESGGHSLLATQLIARVRATFAVDMPLRSLFEAPTLAAFARQIEQASGAQLAQTELPLLARARPARLPLSSSQQRLWFLEQLEQGSVAYHLPAAVRLRGHLQVQALRDSLNLLIERHESLRTTFSCSDGVPFQYIHRALPPSWCQQDLIAHPRTERESLAQQLLQEEWQRPFNLEEGPLMRAFLVRLDEQEYLFSLTLHHMISDAWSNNVLIKEVVQIYTALVGETEVNLPALPIQYADYALWQQGWLQSSELQKQLDYWTSQLSGVMPLELPTDRPRPAIQSDRGARYRRSLPAELVGQLRQLSRREGVTLFMLLAAAFQVLLARYSGQDDITVGTLVANRTQVEVENLIGFFVNTLVLRTDLSGRPSFRQVLEHVREAALGAYAHQDLPFEKLVEALQPERDLSRSPLFQALIVLQNTPSEQLLLPDLQVEVLEVERATARFDLSLLLEEVNEELIACWEYKTDLFDCATIERWSDHFQVLLEGILAQPGQLISHLPLLSESEHEQIIHSWNASQETYGDLPCIHQLFESQVRSTPDAFALLAGTEQLTYSELAQCVDDLAYALHAKGIGPGTRVGICLERSAELLVSLLGVLKAGGTYVPLDPDYPADRLSFMIADAGLSLLLSQKNLASWLHELAPSLEIYCLDEERTASPEIDVKILKTVVSAQQEAYVMYTSGSTGRPKGTIIPHAALSNFCLSMQQQPGFNAHDVILAVTSFSFDIAALELLVPLTVGACIQLVSRHDATDGVVLREILTKSQATIMQATPATWRMLLLAGWQGKSGLRVLCGGEALSLELAQQLQTCGSQLWNMYGPTETTIWSTIAEIKNTEQRISIGRPIANTTIYVLDEHLSPVPIGVSGQLYIGGAGLAQGYLHLPALTAERFIPDPFGHKAGSRLYFTGDMARYRTDGNIEYLGRQDHQVKLRGYRIELEEIEVRLRTHADIADAAVVVQESVSGEKQLIAYSVPARLDTPLASVQLRDFLRQSLPDYMVPGIYVQLERLPLTPNGKLDRKALPALDQYRSVLKTAYLAPRTTTEEILAEIWSGILSIAAVGIDDNFFELGGHSLLAVRMLSAIRSILHVELPLRVLFTLPTIAQLAEHLSRAAQLPALTSPMPVSREQVLPLSFAQQRLWFLHQLDPVNPAYNMPLAVRLQGIVNVDALRESLLKLVERHESLRTTFAMQGEQPVQVINPTASFTLRQHNLTHLSPVDRQVALDILARSEAEIPFDLTCRPLLRALLVQTEPQEYILYLTQHHIISDAWSHNILLRELMQLYRAQLSGLEVSLPPLAIQYADYAVWQRERLQGEVLEQQMSYWRERLRDVETLEFPTDYARPAMLSGQGQRLRFNLPQALSQQLETLSQQEGTTLFMTLLAAFQILLARYSGQEDIAVGTPIANRGQTEIEQVIGLFLNTLVLRTQVVLTQTFRELLHQVSQLCLEAYAHQDVPFEHLVEALQPQRDLNHSPLFQVMLVVQHEEEPSELIEGLRVEPLEIEVSTAKFDLTLSLTRTAQGLRGWWEYSTDLFRPSTIERLSANFQTLLEGLLTWSDQPVSHIPLLAPAERTQVLSTWNTTARAYDQASSLPAAFAAQAERTPQATALVFEQQSLSYQQLEQRANQLAHALHAQGVGPEVRVGICLQRSLELLVGLLGILKAGGTYVPLDPGYPAERLAFLLEDAQVPLVLTQQALLSLLPPGSHQVLCLDRDWPWIATQPATSSGLPAADPDQAAYLIYTSGSTGVPKGVINTHRGILNRLAWGQDTYQLTEKDVVLQKTPISFDISVWECFWPLTTGAKLVLARPGGHQEPSYLVTMMAEQGVSVVHFVPSMLRLWLDEPHLQRCERLRLVICSGEAFSLDLQEQFLQRVPQVSLENLYGPTEAAVEVTRWTCVPEPGARSVPIGHPIANMQLYVLDRQQQPVPIGAVGELYIGGVGVARGYLHRAGLTAERFVPDPFVGTLLADQLSAASYERGVVDRNYKQGFAASAPGARLYRTGDLGRYREDGAIEYLGRRDQQVKLRGYRIELEEIEVGMRGYAGVQDAVVVMREGRSGYNELVGYVVVEKGAWGEEQMRGLREYLRERLPGYMIPQHLVMLESLPLTPSGKVDRRALPVVSEIAPDERTQLALPRTPIEEILIEIWRDVLEQLYVDTHAQFFEIGGHSLLATQVVSRISATLQIELPLRTLFEIPCLSKLAAHIEHQMREPQGLVRLPLLPASRDQDLPLSFAQQRLWFLDQLNLGDPAYNLPLAARIHGQLNVVALEQSLNEVIRRHEMLRTIFVEKNGHPVQQIISYQLSIEQNDLRPMSAMAKEEAIQRLAQMEADAPFDLRRLPLIRVRLLWLDDQEYLLLMTLHHIVADGWSLGVLLRELADLYPAFAQGEAPPLSELSIQYADFAIWQRQWLREKVLDAHLRYWTEQLRGVPPLQLPTDRPRQLMSGSNGASHDFRLSAELSHELLLLSQREGVTLFMTLLAAFQTLLYRHTQQEDILVGTDIANRTHTETEKLIGFFVNLLALRTTFRNRPGFQEVLRSVRKTVLDAYMHQDAPFEYLVEALEPESSLQQMPLIQVLFVLQNTPTFRVELPGLTFSSFEREGPIPSKFELAVFMHESPEGLLGTAVFRTDLFDQSTIATWMEHFTILLQSIIQRIDTPVHLLEMDTEAERLQKAQRQAGRRRSIKAAKRDQLNLTSGETNQEVSKE